MFFCGTARLCSISPSPFGQRILLTLYPALAARGRLIDNYYDQYGYDEDGAYFEDEANDLYDEEYDEGYDYYDEDYAGDEGYYEGDYYGDENYGDDYYGGDYYDEGEYDEYLQSQIAALQNYYDMNMGQYQRAYNQKYMNLMNAYNRLLSESNVYTNNFYDGMNGMNTNSQSAMNAQNVANAYNGYDNQYAYDIVH